MTGEIKCKWLAQYKGKCRGDRGTHRKIGKNLENSKKIAYIVKWGQVVA
jgi:hypothetical protein